MTMSKKTLKLTAAGALVACGLGVAALGVAWATPPQGVTGHTIAGPVVFDEIDIESRSKDHSVKIKTKGLTDAHVAYRRFAPGGHSGWHSHPGPVLILVTAGTATIYDDSLMPVDYPAGTGFVEAGDAHLVANEGDTDLELIAVFLVPHGAPTRIDEPAPQP
jgi:quercetin dioxygenase-like cupin family protein